jgi:hypothetical protein
VLKSRTTVSDAGGVLEVARRWSRTGSDTAASDALFAPFGRLSVDDKDAVTDLLSRHAGTAEELWAAALSSAADLPRPVS